MERAGAAHGLPPALLAALWWEVTRYSPLRIDRVAEMVATRRAEGLADAVAGALTEMRVPAPEQVAGTVVGAFAVMQARALPADRAQLLAAAFRGD